MDIVTREQKFQYQIKKLLQNFKEANNIETSGEEFFEEVWYNKNLAEELGKTLLEHINNFDEELL